MIRNGLIQYDETKNGRTDFLFLCACGCVVLCWNCVAGYLKGMHKSQGIKRFSRQKKSRLVTPRRVLWLIVNSCAGGWLEEMGGVAGRVCVLNPALLTTICWSVLQMAQLSVPYT